MSALLSDRDDTIPRRAAPGWAQAELFIVMNQASGHEEKDAVREAIEAELQQAGRKHRFLPVPEGQIVQTCHQAARLAREHGGVLVAVGGDGTIGCGAQAALAQDCPLGVIAQGTFNLFARQLGLPLDAAEAARALLQAQPELVQVGLVNQRAFLVNASVGLYPKLLADREAAKQRLGRRRVIALLSALKTMLEWRTQLVLNAEVDGQATKLRTASLFVCNNALQLQRIGMEEELIAQLGEGRLAALLVPAADLWGKLRVLAAAAMGRLGQEREMRSFALRSLSVGSVRARRLKVATDGEVQWMEVPLRFTVSPRPLQVMLPPPDQRLPVE